MGTAQVMTQRQPWWRSGWAMWSAAVVIPPVGAVLLWLRPWRGGWVRRGFGFIGRGGLTFVLAILSMIYAVSLGIVHMEMSGAGWKPIFSLRDPARDQDALEQHRARQGASAPAQVTPTATPAAQKDTATKAERLDTQSAEKHRGHGGAATAQPGATETTLVAGPTEWSDFRGANREGRYDQPILTTWPSGGLKRLWRQPVGGGYASFTVVGGRAFTIEQRRDREVVAAYDLRTGRELWTHGWAALFSETMGGDGPRATPTWDEGRVYALGATGELQVLDAASGQLIWSRNILADNGAANLVWGMAASPLVVDDKVIVLPGGSNGKSVVAYNKSTGEPIWKALDDQQAYCSPVVVTLAGQRQLLVVSAERILGMTVEEGRLLWSYPWRTMYDINSAQPIVTDANHVLVSSGYDHGSVLLEITAPATPRGEFRVKPVWENREMKSRFNSSVLHQGYIYGFDESIFACIDARTGERKWKGGRYGYGQVLLASGHLIVLTESGEVVLLRATPERHEELARFSAIEGKTWNHPAIADGVLLVRNHREMAAFELIRK